MSDKVEDITKNLPHYVVLALCLEVGAGCRCFHRWIAIVPQRTNLLQLECPKCGGQDSFASFQPTDFAGE